MSIVPEELHENPQPRGSTGSNLVESSDRRHKLREESHQIHTLEIAYLHRTLAKSKPSMRSHVGTDSVREDRESEGYTQTPAPHKTISDHDLWLHSLETQQPSYCMYTCEDHWVGHLMPCSRYQ